MSSKKQNLPTVNVKQRLLLAGPFIRMKNGRGAPEGHIQSTMIDHRYTPDILLIDIERVLRKKGQARNVNILEDHRNQNVIVRQTKRMGHPDRLAVN